MPNKELEDLFPKLQPGNYSIQSPPIKSYNCIAWALRDTGQFWDPLMVPVKGYYWPPGINRDEQVVSLIAVFALHNVMPCDTGDLEDGVEKIAIYGKSDGTYTHAARQLEGGQWTSKLGKLEDIYHDSVNLLEGDYNSSDDGDYGVVVQFMKRQRYTPEASGAQ
jgi:hypothetical protein